MAQAQVDHNLSPPAETPMQVPKIEKVLRSNGKVVELVGVGVSDYLLHVRKLAQLVPRVNFEPLFALSDSDLLTNLGLDTETVSATLAGITAQITLGASTLFDPERFLIIPDRALTSKWLKDATVKSVKKKIAKGVPWPKWFTPTCGVCFGSALPQAGKYNFMYECDREELFAPTGFYLSSLSDAQAHSSWVPDNTGFPDLMMMDQDQQVFYSAPRPLKRGYENDAGTDIYSSEAYDGVFVKPSYVSKDGTSAFFKISTKTKIAIPAGLFIKLEARSSMAKRGYGIMGGVVDADYRGECHVLMSWNTPDGATMGPDGSGMYGIKKGEAICQAIMLPVPKVKWIKVDECDLPPVSEGQRGDKGLGSTGTGLE